MHALVDLDIFCYEFGHARGEDQLPLEWGLVEWRMDQRLEQILDATQAESWTGFLSGPTNFRNEVATILPYKGNRDRGDRPFWYQGVYNYFKRLPNVVISWGREADDDIADSHNTSDTVVCSRDKDFRQLPGWHYTWPSYKQEERPPYYVNHLDGHRFLYFQMLCGDNADNILGLYGVGPKSALVERLSELSSEEELEHHVREQYRKRFGSYANIFFDENMKLLKIGSN